MAFTLVVAGLKGGVGKTTLSTNLAVCLLRAGHRTLLVDTDPERTCLVWSSKAADAGLEGPPVVHIEGRSLRKDLASVSQGFDAVVIDSPGNNGTEARAAMLVADVVLLPVVPGGPDMWLLQRTVALLEDARQVRPNLRAVVVFNRADTTTLARTSRTALEGLDVAVLEHAVTRRVAFGEAMLSGQGVVDYAPESDAAREIRRLTKALLRMAREE